MSRADATETTALLVASRARVLDRVRAVGGWLSASTPPAGGVVLHLRLTAHREVDEPLPDGTRGA